MSISSDSQECSSFVPYIGISTAAASISVYSLARYAIPNKKAREAAPYTYHIGKSLLACGALTSGISSACGFKKVAEATHSQIDDRYFDIAGAALPLGYLLSVAGDCMVNRAAMIAHDKKIIADTTDSVRTALLSSLRNDQDVV